MPTTKCEIQIRCRKNGKMSRQFGNSTGKDRSKAATAGVVIWPR